ncbi:hypothetical protein AK812_SmicGene41948 [Symbiodinium microadriaticum]|uniref:Uncharacterized protein n=1 Tax=Symbiodinium microadriaticum TaxID=2951 RepID=A0A1Q9C4T2_SYMMI|nr:hypothetical protein AK812_SmicGene41948 [Symbiodinium microadriaticum]
MARCSHVVLVTLPVRGCYNLPGTLLSRRRDMAIASDRGKGYGHWLRFRGFGIRHFLLYQFCVCCERDVETLRFSVEVERPLVPPALGTARQKVSRRPQQPDQEVAGAAEEKPSGPGGEDLSEEEIQRLVEEKLRETEARLEAKLAAREQQFMERLASK